MRENNDPYWQDAKNSVRKWEKFSDEELRYIWRNLASYDDDDEKLFKNFLNEIKAEREFRLTLKEHFGQEPKKITHLTGEFELLEDEKEIEKTHSLGCDAWISGKEKDCSCK